jgi:CNT family concentrative nucleoside transporter
MSENKKAIIWNKVFIGIGLQLIFALFLLKTLTVASFDLFYPLKWFINTVSRIFVIVVAFTLDGSKMLFGPLADQAQMSKVFPESGGFVFAFMALTNIIYFGALMAILYYLGIMQFVIKLMAKFMVKLLNISGSEAVSVAANVFVGQTEAPLVIKPYVEKMTRSELLTLMVGGMATIAGSVMAVYVAILGGADEILRNEVASRFLAASLMAAPATIVISKILLPETEHSLTKGKVEMEVDKNASNVIEAAANGASDGMKLYLNVLAMLLAFVGIIYLLNYCAAGIFGLFGLQSDFTTLVGYVFSVFGLIIGVPYQDLIAFGTMLGQKLILNEFFAYFTLSQIQSTLQAKTVFLSTFAFCGFANFSSIAIQIGGIGGLAPSRKSDIAKFGIRAVIAGTLSTLLTASIAGMFFL